LFCQVTVVLTGTVRVAGLNAMLYMVTAYGCPWDGGGGDEELL
jgi:hypothetical protein